MPVAFEPLKEFPEAGWLVPKVFSDDRGWFAETFKASDLAKAGLPGTWNQENLAYSQKAGTLRGIHFQNEPKAQAKVVRVLSGAIHDVIVDLRKGSPTFGKHAAFRIDATGPRALYVPVGFGHGLCTLTDDVLVQYRTSNEYDAALDRSIRFDDPQLAIAWPTTRPILSEKDAKAPALAASDVNFTWRP